MQARVMRPVADADSCATRNHGHAVPACPEIGDDAMTTDHSACADAVFMETARAIAAALGPGWTAERSYTVDRKARLIGPDEQRLFIIHGDDSHRRSDRGHLRVVTSYGQFARYLHPGEGGQFITVAAVRPAEDIAAAITSRLLPDYVRILGLCRGRARADDAAIARRRTTLDALAAILHATMADSDRAVFGQSYDPIHGEVAVLDAATVAFRIEARKTAAVGVATSIAALNTGSNQANGR
ncbi:hypothetical protein IU451_15425 [Nocardia cyriacigeorgica]|uniref:hypothetical protein n=1 Tax=Nocardia cyriacigeorgica TaxID=135487 RepID=UPI001895EE5D|nr:hypothetical protein [Nocardia cyriacigeorgica]MBF6323909.1 hypothetical protein [Nocardia cyriacigeorgica]